MSDRDLEQGIRERAFFIWIEQGRPEGRDKEHWQQAESELMAGIAAPESELKSASNEATQVAPEEAPPIQAAPGIEAIGQIRDAAAREVDEADCGQRQFQAVAPSWDVYRR